MPFHRWYPCDVHAKTRHLTIMVHVTVAGAVLGVDGHLGDGLPEGVDEYGSRQASTRRKHSIPLPSIAKATPSMNRPV
jgi:hypothetical protein